MEVPGNVDACAGVEFYNGILVPDFVNAHCHLELSYLKGAIPQGEGLPLSPAAWERCAA